MKISNVVRGAVAGAIGGMAMAMWSMVALAAAGNGFSTPVNLIAHGVWDSAPLDGAFNGRALAIGLGVHMAISMMAGVSIAVGAALLGIRSVNATVGLAVGVGIVAWIVGIVAWRAIDRPAFDEFTPWVLAVGHVMFAMAAGLVLVVSQRISKTKAATFEIVRPIAA